MSAKRPHHGIRLRHARSCHAVHGADCSCHPRYEAWVYSPHERRKIRKSFPTLAAARGWRADATVALRQGTLRAPVPTTLRQAANAWLEGARAGTIRNRSGDPYKPSALRGYERALTQRILPAFGAVKLAELQRLDLQDFVDRMLADGLQPSTIRNALMPLRALYRRALARGEVALNPTSGLELPAVRGRRDRIVSPQQAAKLLAALPDDQRALWATALYAGLRRGELMALRWQDIDLTRGVIRVQHSWDIKEGETETKSRAGRRSVPIPALLREHLLRERLRSGRRAGLAFGRTTERPFEPVTVRARALAAWQQAELTTITLHEARHSFASLMIVAGVNAKALSTYMGHASITITLDRYGHLLPGNEQEAATLLNAYLARDHVNASSAQPH